MLLDLEQREHDYAVGDKNRTRNMCEEMKSCKFSKEDPHIRPLEDDDKDTSVTGPHLEVVYPGARGKCRGDIFPTEVVAMARGGPRPEAIERALARGTAE